MTNPTTLPLMTDPMMNPIDRFYNDGFYDEFY